MKQILSRACKVVKALVKAGYTMKADPQYEADHLEYFKEGDQEIIVGDDGNREEWVITFFDVRGGTQPLKEVLIKVLGEPSKVHAREGGGQVLNWKPTKKALIVFHGDLVDFTQEYVKR